mmetsp:Transcript_52898/g.129178  ORF Transcript_52898/g.129178 Transcript_52898/m.129178 type:complete len:206 (+) Transcript_52898:177-794(+)|eukprot:CAMPEP_0206241200 /NCGR_PEP_ID=MMETSP0047_2-20121206/16367_1 /ASSEMBLY_ACC=CAM_ASM_000192 /TAXON_ID=195065 /ORGANISM="Chroomonas mesostigmatica_cf, Strain CCMP1168" /LENGTH=205 /DNA_ID=CAMNT_0053666077 /DNA_START=169 /DNA_END=786 /DNA_ORIENTATION=+
MAATLRHGLRMMRAASSLDVPASSLAKALRPSPPAFAAPFSLGALSSGCTQASRYQASAPVPAILAAAGRLMVCSMTSRSMCTPTDVPKPKKPHSWSRPPGAKAPGQPLGQVTAVPNENLPADPWTPVTDPKTGYTYYWNQLTNETTAIGEPKPDGMYRQGAQQQVYEYQPQTLLGSLGGMFLWGMGITFGFAIVGALFRMLFGM